jgi:sugar-phosphatase
MSVEAVLFDIDGTLIDSTPAVERTWRSWATARGIDPATVLRVSHGRRTRDTLADFIPEAEIAEAVAELERMERGDLDDVVALPAAAELLALLPAGRWAAVTSGSRALMRDRLRAAGIPVPGVLVSAEDVGAGKPDPEGYLAAAARLGADPRRCLVVEDAPAGIGAGRAAGARVLAVATSHEPGQLTGADVVVEDLRSCAIVPEEGGLRVTLRPMS